MASKPKPSPTPSSDLPSPDPREAQIAEKVKAGLTPEQAEQVLNDQAAFDKTTKAKA